MILSRKSKHAIKSTIPEIEIKQNSLTRELNPLGNMNKL